MREMGFPQSEPLTIASALRSKGRWFSYASSQGTALIIQRGSRDAELLESIAFEHDFFL